MPDKMIRKQKMPISSPNRQIAVLAQPHSFEKIAGLEAMQAEANL